jgi:hypothetical protein
MTTLRLTAVLRVGKNIPEVVKWPNVTTSSNYVHFEMSSKQKPCLVHSLEQDLMMGPSKLPSHGPKLPSYTLSCTRSVAFLWNASPTLSETLVYGKIPGAVNHVNTRTCSQIFPTHLCEDFRNISATFW